MLSNYGGNLQGHIFQGGNADQLEKDLKLDGDEILYLGDHIFGDIVSIKKSCNWRTALVLAPIKQEIDGIKESLPIQTKIDELTAEKVHFELSISKAQIKSYFQKQKNLINKSPKKLWKNNQSLTLTGESS